jgi:hypothetical protein
MFEFLSNDFETVQAERVSSTAYREPVELPKKPTTSPWHDVRVFIQGLDTRAVKRRSLPDYPSSAHNPEPRLPRSRLTGSYPAAIRRFASRITSEEWPRAGRCDGLPAAEARNCVERSMHPLAVAEAGLVGDGLHRVAPLLQHQRAAATRRRSTTARGSSATRSAPLASAPVVRGEREDLFLRIGQVLDAAG